MTRPRSGRASGNNCGIPMVIVGAVLAMFGGLLSVPLWYLDVVGPLAGSAVGFGVPVVGLVLIVVGAVRNSRGQRQLAPPPPPISN